MEEKKRIVIIGAGGFGRECIETILQDRTLELIGFLDDDESLHGKYLNGVKVLGALNWIHTIDYQPYFVCSIGDPKIKKDVCIRAEMLGFKPVSIVHPAARVYSPIGKGVIIQAGAIVTVNVTIEDHVHINLNCSIGHDSVIGKYSTISPLVSISGNVKLREGVFIGSNAAVLPSVRIGEWTKIGAVACVIKNCISHRTYVGVPARCVR